jgi:ribonuclease HI
MEQKWVIYVDGSSTRKNGGARMVLVTPEGEELSGALRLEFRTTNNEAEYEAVIAGLGMALELGAVSVEVQSDSQVIVGHIQGEFEAKGEKMKKVPRKGTRHADFFSRSSASQRSPWRTTRRQIA